MDRKMVILLAVSLLNLLIKPARHANDARAVPSLNLKKKQTVCSLEDDTVESALWTPV